MASLLFPARGELIRGINETSRQGMLEGQETAIIIINIYIVVISTSRLMTLK